MDIKGQKVSHKTFGTGVVTDQTESLVIIAFDAGEKKFPYPTAFKQFLVFCDPTLQKSVVEEIEAAEREKAALLAKQSLVIREIAPPQKKKKTRAVRPNIAFKCNYCDGGKSSSSIGFNGICSERIIRYNIDVEKRTWCCSDKCACFNHLHGNLTRDELEAELEGGGFVCYESQMLRDWKAMAGVVQHGERKGEPMHLMNVQPSSLCVLTTREPDSTEAERIIFAVFLVDDTYDGDDREEGFVSTQSKFKLSLSEHEAEKMLFWRYHANGNQPEKEAWSSGLHRYLTDIQAVQILRDIAELKKNTKDAELASEFLDTFSRMVSIDAAEVGEPDGVLANK